MGYSVVVACLLQWIASNWIVDDHLWQNLWFSLILMLKNYLKIFWALTHVSSRSVFLFSNHAHYWWTLLSVPLITPTWGSQPTPNMVYGFCTNDIRENKLIFIYNSPAQTDWNLSRSRWRILNSRVKRQGTQQ